MKTEKYHIYLSTKETKLLQYIKAHRNCFYTPLLTKCELNRHLADVNKQAEEMFFRLVNQLAEKEGATGQFKCCGCSI